MLLSFIKKLFAKEENANISLGADFWDPVDLVTPEENVVLEAPFSEEEIKKAIFESYSCGAPGPDGFSFLF